MASISWDAKWPPTKKPDFQKQRPANEIKIGNDTIFRFDIDSGWEISRLNYFGHTDELTIVVCKRKPGDIRREHNE